MKKEIVEKFEVRFLNKLYKSGGMAELSFITDNFYGMSNTAVQDIIIGDLIEKHACVCEEVVMPNDKKRTLIFITTEGLVDIEGADRAGNWPTKNLTYERRIQGYNSYAEWLDANREYWRLQRSITAIYARISGAVLSTYGEEYREEKADTLKEAANLLKKRKKTVEGFASDVSYTILKAIIDKLVADQDSEAYEKEAKDCFKILDMILSERHRKREEYFGTLWI